MEQDHAQPPTRDGIVYIVGAGPGDPELLTLRGRALLDDCDAIVHDAGVASALLKRSPRRTTEAPELHRVGAKVARGSARPEKVGATLVRLARQGKRVVRLMAGDPFVFATGGEEAQALHDAGVAFEIVPGVTAEIAAPAYAGVPVTQWGLAPAVTFVGARTQAEELGARVDWTALARAGGTIVVQAEPDTLARHASALIAGGLPAETPAVLIAHGTTPHQQTLTATLETLGERAAAAELGVPVMAVIGWSVVLRDEISWHDRRPLFGARIAVTDPEPNGPLARRLRSMGADVTEMPSVHAELLDLRPLYLLLSALGDVRWLVLATPQAARTVWETLRVAGRDARALAGVRLCALGPGTAAELLQHGLVADVGGATSDPDDVLEAMRERSDVSGALVLYPSAEGARDVVAAGLREMGAHVQVLPIYRASFAVEEADALRRAVRAGTIELATFASPYEVASFLDVLGPELVPRVPAVCADRRTSAAARDAGLEVRVDAAGSRVDELADAIVLARTSS